MGVEHVPGDVGADILSRIAIALAEAHRSTEAARTAFEAAQDAEGTLAILTRLSRGAEEFVFADHLPGITQEAARYGLTLNVRHGLYGTRMAVVTLKAPGEAAE